MCRLLADIPTSELEQLAANNSQCLARSLGIGISIGVSAFIVTGSALVSMESSLSITPRLVAGVIAGVVSAVEMAEFGIRNLIQEEYEATLRRRCDLD